MRSLLSGQAYRKVGNSPQRGPEWHGPCPVCGGRDRFHIWPEQGKGGTFWCRGCDKSGDLIEFYRWRDNLSYREACARAGVDPQQYNQQSAPPPATSPRQPTFTPAATVQANLVWSEHAAKFAEQCHLLLLRDEQQLAWLAKRGIDGGQVAKFGLGWNPKDTYRPMESWGLPVAHKADGSSRKLWLPKGLVIPQWLDGVVARLRIRRPAGDPKYYVIPGSGREPLITNREASAYVVVESELDAVLLDGVVGNTVGVVAMGNASAKPTSDCHALLARAVHLSISLDSDAPKINPATGKTESAGAQGSLWWLTTYPHAERVPVIGGKDPSDAYQSGVDLRTWVMAGLPPRFRMQSKSLAVTHAGQSQASASSNDVVTPEASVNHRTIILTDGREIHITDSKQTWAELMAEGMIVFSDNELLRVQSACATMNDDEKAKFVGLVVDAKEIFNGAYVQRGEAVA